MNTKTRVAILEAGGSHDEILSSQFEFLRSRNPEIFLIIRHKHLERINIPQYVKILELKEDENILHRINNFLKIRKFLKNKNIKYLIINTAQGAFIRDLCLFLPSGVNVTGISHNPQKIRRSFTQKIISRRIRKYFVLSDPIKENTTRIDSKLLIESFYPVFFEKPDPEAIKSKERFIIAIPGAVDLNRRDYQSLLDELNSKKIPENLQFIFLGRCKSIEARAIRDKFLSVCSADNCIFYNEFIPVDDFLAAISKADLILPLLTTKLNNFDLYRDFKVTGGVNLAYGFRIPLLMHRDLENNSDFSETAFFYEENKLLESIVKLSTSPGLIEEKRRVLDKTLRFSFDYQKQKYLDFITREI